MQLNKIIKSFLKISSCLIVLFYVACKNTPKIDGTTTQLPKDFLTFYEKFHKDSLYQMAHIQFPLQGYPTQADSSQIDNFFWQRENWVMHRLENFSEDQYIREFQIPVDGIVTETIKQKNTPFGIYRRFIKRSEDWTLIFYSSMNAMAEDSKK